jgi:carboxynorspermidine decarboxylase
VGADSGGKVLLALKAFATWSTFPLLRRYLCGTAASGLHEALLAREHFGGEIHVYSPAFAGPDLAELLGFVDHVVFNSLGQWERFRPLVASCGRRVSCGIRVNPEHSEAGKPLYDPCAPHSRLGVTARGWPEEVPDGLEGLHWHNLCEQGADALARTVAAVERRFGRLLGRVRWVNVGGGHHITRPGYDVGQLVQVVRDLRARWGVEVYLEPGEAVALNTGFLVASVLDVIQNGMPVAILDASATAHMPDVLEMPYRPEVVGAGRPGELPYTCRLAGPTCLAGDVIGDYSFARPLRPGGRLVFGDMAHYSMVKNTTFNGVPLPAVATFDPGGAGLKVVRRFGYHDYRDRLS